MTYCASSRLRRRLVFQRERYRLDIIFDNGEVLHGEEGSWLEDPKKEMLEICHMR